MADKITTQIITPDPVGTIEGMHDTGYEFNTALADIVDNSVDADATEIDITIKMDVGGVFISIADNGYGMNEETLIRGMQYGGKGADNPKRLGKFGMGLKTASTAFCRKLSVITRDSKDNAIIPINFPDRDWKESQIATAALKNARNTNPLYTSCIAISNLIPVNCINFGIK